MKKSNEALIPYARKSAKEDPAVSRDRQLGAIDGWAAAAGVPLLEPVFEAGVSGSKPWRDRELGDVIEACERGAAGGIVVEELSRLSRENGLATAEVYDALQRAGVRLVVVADGIDTATGDHELNFAVRAALAREQWKQYARRADHSKRRAIARGVHISAKCPVGYRRPIVEPGEPARPLEIDPKAAPAVTSAFELRATGAPVSAVVALLEELLPGGPDGRGRWTRDTVKRLLRNRVYLGEARQGKYSKPGAHPVLVELPVFDTVQALERPEPRAVPRSTVALLAGGIARCASCGYGLSKQGAGGGVYRCRAHSASSEKCAAPASIPAGELEEYVEAAARERFESARSRISRVAVEVDVVELHSRLAALREQRLMYEDGAFALQLGPEAALRALQKIDDEIAAVKGELAEAVGSAADAELLDRDQVWPEDLDERRGMIRAGLDAVIVSRRPSGPRPPIEQQVELRFRGDGPPTPRPSRGRRGVDAELEAGEAAA